MFEKLSDIIKLPAAVLAGIGVSVLFYEGVRLPVVGPIIPGIVWYRVNAATSTMVTQFERNVLAAQLAEERRLRAIADAANARAQERADATQLAKAAADARIKAYETEARDAGLQGWTKEELEWLGKH